MAKIVKKQKENRHIYGVFLRIIKKCRDHSRILVMELPSGEFIDGVIKTETILKVKLRHIISVDMKRIRTVNDINKVVFHKSYNIQPSGYPNDTDTELL